MSQPCEQFNFAAVDAFLTPAEQELYLARTLSDDLCGTGKVNHPVFSPYDDDVLEELDLFSHDASEGQLSSSDSSSTSTPEPQSYIFDGPDPILSHLVAIPSTQHCHHHERQHTNHGKTEHVHEHEHLRPDRSNDDVHSPLISPRSLPFRSSTTSDFLHPDPTSQPYVRRRSLSHSDIDQLIEHPPNPTLVRLRQRRARSSTPEGKKRPGPYPTHGRAASGGRSRGRPVQTSSTARENIHFDRRAPMQIDASLTLHSETTSGKEPNYDPSLDDEYYLSCLSSTHHEDPAIRYMTDLHELERSRRIIEIGAMSAFHRPSHIHIEDLVEGTELERVLKKVEDVERHFQENSIDPKILKACSVVRETLAQEMAMDKLDRPAHRLCEKGFEVVQPPTGVLSTEDWRVYIGDEDGSGISAMLMMDDIDEVEDCI